MSLNLLLSGINKIITIYTQLAFEISNLSDVDIILPHWCMQQHQPVNLFDKDANLITFSSDYCRKHCCTPADLQPPPDTRGASCKNQGHLDSILSYSTRKVQTLHSHYDRRSHAPTSRSPALGSQD